MPADYTAPAPGSTDWDTTLNAALAAIADRIPQKIGYVQRTSNLTGVTSETVVVTTASVAFPNNRAFRVTAKGLYQSRNNHSVEIRVRKGNTVGGTLWLDTFAMQAVDNDNDDAADNSPFYQSAIVINETGSTINTAVSMWVLRRRSPPSGATTVGTVATATHVTYLLIEDIGPSSDYPGAFDIT